MKKLISIIVAAAFTAASGAAFPQAAQKPPEKKTPTADQKKERIMESTPKPANKQQAAALQKAKEDKLRQDQRDRNKNKK